MYKDEVLEIIKQRRSVYPRQYTGEKIENNVVKELLEAANWAPTHKYTEPWRFKVFNGESLEKLVAFQRQLYVDTTLPTEIKETKLKVFDEVPSQASHIIAMIMERNPIIPEMEEIASVAMAVQNLWLATIASGYGGYWSTGGGTFNTKMHRWLGLNEETQTLMGFFYMGVPSEPLPKGTRRSSIENKVEWM
jgi:nitroreductase